MAGQLPELQLLPSEEERGSVMIAAWDRHLRGKRGSVRPLAFVMSIALAVPLVLMMRVTPGGQPSFLTGNTLLNTVILGGLNILPIAGLIVFYHRRILPKEVRRELVRRGVPVCIGCGYCLRGSSASTCPECGIAVEDGDQQRFG